MPEPVWVAPDARIDEPTPPVPAAVAPPAPQPSAPPAVPVPLRPLTTGDRLDGSLRILRLAPGTVIALAAVAVVPVHLLSVLVLPGPSDPGRAPWEPMFGRGLVTILADDDGERILRGVLLVALDSIALAFVAAGITILVTGWYVGRSRTAAEVLAAAARRLPALVVAWVAVHAAEAVFGLALALPALLPMAWGAVVVPVLAAEGRGSWASLRRSFRLTTRAFGPVLGTCLLAALVDLLLRGALTVLVAGYAESELPASRALVVVVAIAVRLVTVPFVAGVAALLYLDLRVRLEGLDIELAAQERFPVAAP